MSIDHPTAAMDEHALPDAAGYVLTGGAWDVSGGGGSNGSVVTYSIMDGGIIDVFNSIDSSFIPTTVGLGAFLGFDYKALIQQAFDAWSSVADIEFIGIEDGGGQIGAETMADIRLGGGAIPRFDHWFAGTHARLEPVALVVREF